MLADIYRQRDIDKMSTRVFSLSPFYCSLSIMVPSQEKLVNSTSIGERHHEDVTNSSGMLTNETQKGEVISSVRSVEGVPQANLKRCSVGSDSSQVPGDTFCPGLDGFPIGETHGASQAFTHSL